jgi:hypothetical protein
VTFPEIQTPDYGISDVLHLLIDHGRLPDEVTVNACHQAVRDHYGSHGDPDTAPDTSADTAPVAAPDTAPAVLA